jgi:hypothetical protein
LTCRARIDRYINDDPAWKVPFPVNPFERIRERRHEHERNSGTRGGIVHRRSEREPKSLHPGRSSVFLLP